MASERACEVKKKYLNFFLLLMKKILREKDAERGIVISLFALKI